jgi:tRNA wybutosine-synthesizing protein 2
MNLPAKDQDLTHRSKGLEDSKNRKLPKSKPTNPIEDAINIWFSSLPPELLEQTAIIISVLQATAPKRWVVYSPMLLLPSGSFEDKRWTDLQLTDQDLELLWQKVLELVGKREGKGVLTHLAINNGIPLHKPGEDEGENLRRNPLGLKILYGDFGPPLDITIVPSPDDLETAFWVSTKQNGIIQIWAPRYTMFSRGNIKEKARILGFHDTGLDHQRQAKANIKNETAIDLYAGIGYFVFSYAKMGMGKVVGFELNPWSVEGLRRGAIANGWDVKVVIAGQVWIPGEEKIAIFEEDNAMARSRLSSAILRSLGDVSHINCGLLPSSEGGWELALGLLTASGWLHIHENVGVNNIEARKGIIKNALSSLSNTNVLELQVEHVELVKTFAPGVWHCVFDVYVTRG